MSYTFCFDGRSSTLTANFKPLIDLRKRGWADGDSSWSENGTWVMGLIDFSTYHTVPNIDSTNDLLYYQDVTGTGVFKKLVIPTGAYSVTDLNDYIKKKLKKENIDFELTANNSTGTAAINCNTKLDFTRARTIRHLIGYPSKIFNAGTSTSIHPVTITRINIMRILCNITAGSYRNGDHLHVIHEFFPNVPPGFKIIEVPKTVIYLPINTSQIDHITLQIVDQDNNPIDFREEAITVRLHLKRIPWE